MLKAMSARLSAAKSIAVTTTEEVQRVTRSGEKRTDHLINEITLRRPDRLWFRMNGDRDLEGFYEGDRLTLVSHKEKVFGTLRTPPTIDGMLQMVSDRYGIPVPVGDLLTSNSQGILMSSQTTGGWLTEEQVDGTTCALLKWQHPNVDWSIWIPTAGEPLPRKLHIVFKARRGRPETTVHFTRWNLAAAVNDDTFARKVPADYEGIAVIQQAHAVLPALERQSGKPEPSTAKP
jgi:hypothetical protein